MAHIYICIYIYSYASTCRLKCWMTSIKIHQKWFLSGPHMVLSTPSPLTATASRPWFPPAQGTLQSCKIDKARFRFPLTEKIRCCAKSFRDILTLQLVTYYISGLENEKIQDFWTLEMQWAAKMMSVLSLSLSLCLPEKDVRKSAWCFGGIGTFFWRLATLGKTTPFWIISNALVVPMIDRRAEGASTPHSTMVCYSKGLYKTPTQPMHYYKENPLNLPYMSCALFDPPKMGPI